MAADKEAGILAGPHPLVSEGGREFAAYRAVPQAGRACGVVLLAEMFGVTEPMKLAARQLAARGFPALVPNLFWRYEPSGVLAYEGAERAQAWDRLQRFETETALTDIRCAAAALRAEPTCDGTVAALGFCMGGRLAVAAAADGAVGAAVSFYGLGISRYADRIARLEVPMQLHYGLRDEHVPQDEVDAVTRAVAGNAHVQMHFYAEAGHSFCNPLRPTYDAAAAELGLARAVVFLSAQHAR